MAIWESEFIEHVVFFFTLLQNVFNVWRLQVLMLSPTHAICVMFGWTEGK